MQANTSTVSAPGRRQSKWISLEPNPARKRGLTDEFFTELARFVEAQTAAGRTCRLLRTHPRGTLLRKLAPEVIVLQALHAIGERGFLLLADPAMGLGDIAPADLEKLKLGAGEFSVYAGLSHRRVAFGGPLREPASADLPEGATFLAHRLAPIELVVGDARLEYRDWIPVGKIRRERDRGGMVTQIDESSHPPIETMAEYQRPNPIVTLVDALLAELAHEPDLVDFKIEVALLQSLARGGSTEAVFLQLQRVALRAPADHEKLSFLRRLIGYPYEHERFCELLEEVARLRGPGSELYPRELVLNGQGFHRLDGDFQGVPSEPYWHWQGPCDGKHVDAMALFFPQAAPGDLPQIFYDTEPIGSGSPAIARLEQRHSHTGVAMLLDEIRGKSPVSSLYISEMVGANRHRLELWLSNGHAIYYR